MTFPVYEIVFYFFATLLIGSAVAVITTRHPVYSILFLILAFFASAALWLMIQAEFLALVLIFVYVGAVMTLFLFVVMMLDIDKIVIKEGFVKFLPLALLLMSGFVGMLVYAFLPANMPVLAARTPDFGGDYINVNGLGELLFSHYLFPFEVAGALLLVAIVAAIALAFHGRKPDAKAQDIALQHAASKADRLQLIDLRQDRSS